MVPKTKLSRRGEVLVDQPTAEPTEKTKATGLAGIGATVVAAILAVVSGGIDEQALLAAAGAALAAFVAAYMKRSKA